MEVKTPLVDRLERLHGSAIFVLDWLHHDLERGVSIENICAVLNAVAWSLQYPAHYLLDDLTLVEQDWQQGKGKAWK